MENSTQPPWMTWTGRVLSGIVCLGLVMSAAMKFQHSPEVVDFFTKKFGYPETVLPVIGTLEVVCTLLYAFPKTTPLGAILLTGYLGGAVATHVRVADNFGPPVMLGIMVWAGYFLREARVRKLFGM